MPGIEFLTENNTERKADEPVSGGSGTVRKYTRQSLALLCVLFVVLVVMRMLLGSTYRTGIPWEARSASEPLPELQVDHPEIARVENLALENGRLMFDVVPLKKGSFTVLVPDQNGQPGENLSLAVTRSRAVYDPETGSFTGDLAVMILITVFLLLISAMMLHGVLTAKGPELYSYSTMFYTGFFFFALLTGFTMMGITLRHILRADTYSMLDVYDSLGGAAVDFLNITFPLLVAFSLALAVSNIALLRHNRPRVQNALGLIISLLIVGGAVFGLWLSGEVFARTLREFRIRATVGNVYCMAFVYFECILAGAVICGIRAARHRVPAGRDVIIILGCWFRKDGSLPPLLRCRVDRAIAYWHDTREQTGREAFLIPSGGRGTDESMPEAEAMRAYLIAQGIPERLILPEAESASTYQNLLFSRRIMEEHGLPRSCVYATTNYHVFRSGMWAAKAGLDAEGISSRTRWWFWPNAFIRECVSLVADRWKLELALLLALITFFGLLSLSIV